MLDLTTGAISKIKQQFGGQSELFVQLTKETVWLGKEEHRLYITDQRLLLKIPALADFRALIPMGADDTAVWVRSANGEWRSNVRLQNRDLITGWKELEEAPADESIAVTNLLRENWQGHLERQFLSNPETAFWIARPLTQLFGSTHEKLAAYSYDLIAQNHAIRIRKLAQRPAQGQPAHETLGFFLLR
jgi:hypothetical protein